MLFGATRVKIFYLGVILVSVIQPLRLILRIDVHRAFSRDNQNNCGESDN